MLDVHGALGQPPTGHHPGMDEYQSQILELDPVLKLPTTCRHGSCMTTTWSELSVYKASKCVGPLTSSLLAMLRSERDGGIALTTKKWRRRFNEEV